MAVWSRIVRTTCFAAVTVVAVPYAVALMTNILCGWPLCTKRYRRAFNPYKVFALNWALLIQLGKLRYVGLMIRWRRFYQNASKSRLIKNVPYGSNGNCLDIYFPTEEMGQKGGMSEHPRPVIVFLYGGSWGSGDKNMYGLLASQLADTLTAVVICPNYSIYPKGFVDDMAQDVSDVLAFVHQHCDIYFMDKARIALLGHSAGAHLAALTVLELSMKHLLDEPTSETSVKQREGRVDGGLQVSVIEASSSSGIAGDKLRLHERHFNGDSDAGDVQSKETAEVANSFYVVDTTDSGKAGSASGGDAVEAAGDETLNITETNDNEPFCFVDDKSVSVNAESTELTLSLASQPSDTETKEQHDPAEESDDRIESRTETSGEAAAAETALVVQPSLNDTDSLLTSVRLVIGISGVYDIAAHYQHEAMRGLEDVSTMARAMYGPKRFDRFSPTLIIDNLPQNARLPPIHLIHGSDDHVVPVSSSTCFGDAVWRHGASVVTATVISGCGHYDICMDLMETDRFWYSTVMTEIWRAFLEHMQRA